MFKLSTNMTEHQYWTQHTHIKYINFRFCIISTWKYQRETPTPFSWAATNITQGENTIHYIMPYIYLSFGRRIALMLV